MKLRKEGSTNDVAFTVFAVYHPAGWVVGLTLGTGLGQCKDLEPILCLQ